MSDLRKICPSCKQFVCCASYARHVKSHKVQFHCNQCHPTVSFNRRDSLIRHLKLHGNQCTSNDNLAYQPKVQDIIESTEPTSQSTVQDIAESREPQVFMRIG